MMREKHVYAPLPKGKSPEVGSHRTYRKQKHGEVMILQRCQCETILFDTNEKPHVTKLWKEKEDDFTIEGGHRLRCRMCGHVITFGTSAIALFGASRHVFFNPHGQMFEIGLFSQAPGCVGVGVTTTEFTWFPGFAWQATLCRQCNIHLGWVYTSIDASSRPDAFYGLIMGLLIDDADND
ncbi:cereblon family protein [Desulfovibrio inopinatus]|uniref:cereblon family protein n=1 Tax=Desulfovibrio inopinatus TaxID=102109 RepID=UPI000684E829|nr:cereblon family protein [Desulfovibrio inopinatus]